MVRIAVVDTNVEVKNKVFNNYNISICDVTNRKYIPCGHGTAVCGIIAKNAPDSRIDVFPIFENEYSLVEIGDLVEVLKYILESKCYDIVNLSNGIITSDCINELKHVCDQLKDEGTLVISAYDNTSMMSYPACFDSVIGVDGENSIHNIEAYYWLNNSPVNIMGYSRQRRVAWVGNKSAIGVGNSYLCSQITAFAANYLNGNNVNDIETFFINL